MSTAIKFKKSIPAKTPAIILCVTEDKKLAELGKALDKETKGYIAHALKTAAKFSGKAGETLFLSVPPKSSCDQFILLGIGKAKELDTLKAETIGGKLFASLDKSGIEKAVLLAEGYKDAELTASIAYGFKLRSYKFEKYKEPKKDNKPFKELTIVSENSAAASKAFDINAAIAEGVFTARDLINEPPNTLSPPAYADFIKKELEPLGVDVQILDEKKMKSLKMGGIMAVGQGSAEKPRMVIMRWNGNSSKSKSVPLALVGKGVTFDTGGISIKPSAGMDQMKMDMGGSAAVVGTIKALARRKAKADIVGVVGLAENMPSSNAYRPGDIITSYAGKTIEVMNTDVEGRLVLADCLTYVQEKYKPEAIIDLATLTGAMMVALGYEYCGTFVNDDKLWKGMETASTETGEKLWRMPLDSVYKKDMESQTADLQNTARTLGRYGGACTAAGFLEHFIEDGVNWAHMDIAGTAYIKSDKPTVPKFGTGFGVRVLDRLIANMYEK